MPTDFETHPVGTGARLAAWEEYAKRVESGLRAEIARLEHVIDGYLRIVQRQNKDWADLKVSSEIREEELRQVVARLESKLEAAKANNRATGQANGEA